MIAGAWTVTAAALPGNAQYTAQVIQGDGAGNSGSAPRTFAIDTLAPTPTIGLTTPPGYVNTTTPTIAGTAGTQVADGTHSADNPTVTVKIFPGAAATGSPLQTFTSVPVSGGGSWSISESALAANAQYTVQVVQGDGAGNSGNQAASFVIDTVVPSPTVTAPANSSYTNLTTPAISGTAGSQTADASHSADNGTVTVKIFPGATATGSPLQTFNSVPVASGSWSVSGSALAGNAQYTVQVSQGDGAGNNGTGTSTFVIDTTAPAPTVTAPPAYVNTTTPAISGTAGTQAADASHSADNTTVTVKIFSGPDTSGAPLQTINLVPVTAGTWTATPAALPPNAQYTAQVTQSDGAGNSASTATTFVIDATSPVVTLTAPANNSYTNNTKPTFSGTAGQAAASSTASADSTTVTVKIFTGANTSGMLVQTLTTTESSGAWSVTPTTALTANAQYTAQASQTDGAGNTGTSSANTFAIDTIPPTVAMTAPASNTTTPTFSGTAGNNAGSATTSADNATLTVFVCSGTQTSCGAAGPSLFETLTATRSGTTWSVTPTAGQALTNSSSYTAQAAQTDVVGNTGTSSIRTWTVSTASTLAVVNVVNEDGTGNTAGQVNNGDKVVVVFSSALDPSSVCPTTWTNTQTEQSTSAHFELDVKNGTGLITENITSTICGTGATSPANWGTDDPGLGNGFGNNVGPWDTSSLTYCPSKSSSSGDPCNDVKVTGPSLVVVLGGGGDSSSDPTASAATFTPSTSIQNNVDTLHASGSFTQATAVEQF